MHVSIPTDTLLLLLLFYLFKKNVLKIIGYNPEVSHRRYICNCSLTMCHIGITCVRLRTDGVALYALLVSVIRVTKSWSKHESRMGEEEK